MNGMNIDLSKEILGTKKNLQRICNPKERRENECGVSAASWAGGRGEGCGGRTRRARRGKQGTTARGTPTDFLRATRHGNTAPSSQRSRQVPVTSLIIVSGAYRPFCDFVHGKDFWEGGKGCVEGRWRLGTRTANSRSSSHRIA